MSAINGTFRERISSSISIPDFGIAWVYPVVVDPDRRWAISDAVIDHHLAAAMIQRNRKNNRRLKQSNLDRLKHDMTNGNWRFNHEGIAFNSRGELIDGQHRLFACIQSQSVFRTLVFFGFDEMETVNTGATRDAYAAATICGIDATKNEMATLRNFLMGTLTHWCSFTNAEMLKKHQIHRQMIKWIHGEIYQGALGMRVFTAPVRGAIGRAYYHEPTERLLRFINILKLDTPATQPGDRTAITLRNHLESQATTSGYEARAATFSRTLRAIQSFLNGEDLKIIRPTVQDDIYPITAGYEVNRTGITDQQ